MLFSGCVEWAFLLQAIIWEYVILNQASDAVDAAVPADVAHGNLCSYKFFDINFVSQDIVICFQILSSVTFLKLRLDI